MRTFVLMIVNLICILTDQNAGIIASQVVILSLLNDKYPYALEEIRAIVRARKFKW